MLKALFKKQMLELSTWFFQDKKTGRNRSKAGILGYAMLYLVLIVVFGGIFVYVSDLLCEPLLSLNLDWLYFAMMGMMAIALGVFGSVFNTFTTLYQAKDNELLLSLPIPTSNILLVRLFGVWFWGMVYEALVLVPAIAVYWIKAGSGVVVLLFDIITLLVLSVVILMISCILGWIVAKINGRLKNKSFVTVLASITFLAGYYYVYFKASALLQEFLVNALTIGEKIKTAIYPIYLMGRGAEGDLCSLLILVVVVMVLFVVLWMVLSTSFLKLATAQGDTAGREYKITKMRKKSIAEALLIKEWKRFTSSANYMLNCGLGTLLLILSAVAVLVKQEFLMEIVGVMGLESVIPLLAVVAVCMLAGMNDITAPSISLEGKNLWILQSLPVSAWQVLKAKITLHLWLTVLPAVLFGVCISLALQLEIVSAILVIAVTIVYVLFSASVGVTVNLKMPNLSWTNETAAVKQSFGVMLAMMSSWVFLVVLAGVYVWIGEYFTANGYLLFCGVLIALCTTVLLCWLKKRGTKIFEAL